MTRWTSFGYQYYLCYRFVYAITPLLLTVVLSGCSLAVHVAEEDFSKMPDDIFSKLIKDTHFEYRDYTNPSLEPNTMRFDQVLAIKKSRQLWLGKSSAYTISLFQREKGHCYRVRQTNNRRYLSCDVSRRWRTILKTGIRTETSDKAKRLSIPGARLEYKFMLSNKNVVTGLKIVSRDIRIDQLNRNYFYPQTLYPVISRGKMLR